MERARKNYKKFTRHFQKKFTREREKEKERERERSDRELEIVPREKENRAADHHAEIIIDIKNTTGRTETAPAALNSL